MINFKEVKLKLFILAAGKGERLWPLTKNTPKSLLDLGDGTTLLERQLKKAEEFGNFDEIVIITGYLSDKIDETIKNYNLKTTLRTVYNPFFNTTNNLVSLWTVHFLMENEDFMITNGDNLYKENVFKKILKDDKEIIQITVDSKDEYDEDDMKVKLNKKGGVEWVSKEIPKKDADYESVGLVLVKGKESRKWFIKAMIELLKIKEYHNKFWLEIFNFLSKKGFFIDKVEISKDSWSEIDFHPDYELIKKYLLTK
jgi:choline kinase